MDSGEGGSKEGAKGGGSNNGGVREMSIQNRHTTSWLEVNLIPRFNYPSMILPTLIKMKLVKQSTFKCCGDPRLAKASKCANSVEGLQRVKQAQV